MQNWIENRVNSLPFVRPTLTALLGVVLVLSLGCTGAETGTGAGASSTDLGEWVDTRTVSAYLNPGDKIALPMGVSIALRIARNQEGWQQIMGVNGRVGWIKQALPNYGLARINAKSSPLNYATLPMQKQNDPRYQWRSIAASEALSLVGASAHSGQMTPPYLAQHGRGNLLTPRESPYHWPELHLQWKGGDGWVSPFDLQFLPSAGVNTLPLIGLFVEPFLSLLPKPIITHRPASSLTVSNLSLQTPRPATLPEMHWTAQAAIAIGPQAALDLRYIVLLSNVEQESYLLVLHWQNHLPQYVAFSGWHKGEKETIPTPMLVNYSVEPGTKTLVPSVHLSVAQINGDDYSLESLAIDGRYQVQGPIVRVQ